MAVRLLRPGAADPAPPRHAPGPPARWTCALVNNMPDSAFEASEEQYLGLLGAASGGQTITVRRHTMAGVPRGAVAAARIASEYLPLAHIREDPPDVLIVTGSNPIAPCLADEPYWDEMADLLTWGRDHVPTMLLSCLAAHAALFAFDGLDRQRLATKCTGVFAQVAEPTHPLSRGLVSPLVLPHSRLNTVDEAALVAAGYQVALRTETLHPESAGWSMATKLVGRSQVVLVQGHPEYGPSTLVREYQRDVRRYAAHERDDLPCLPGGCVAPEDWGALAELARRVTGGERDPALVEAFPFDQAGGRAPWPWRTMAIGLYENWLAGVPKRSD
jgi:homoserine O-succinyltransferase/O-acetyltransferase